MMKCTVCEGLTLTWLTLCAYCTNTFGIWLKSTKRPHGKRLRTFRRQYENHTMVFAEIVNVSTN